MTEVGGTWLRRFELPDKLKFDESLVVKYAGAHYVRPGEFSQSVI